MTVRVQENESTGTYELGDDVEGVFIAFATMPKTAVESRVASVLQANEAQAKTEPGAETETETSGEYTDNGDGTYTRSSDGVTGRFGPSGFTAAGQS